MRAECVLSQDVLDLMVVCLYLVRILCSKEPPIARVMFSSTML
jgi:hypothetical protein